MPRPRKYTDEQIRRVYEPWKAGRISLSRAAQMLGAHADTVRYRFAEWEPQFEHRHERHKANARRRFRVGSELTAKRRRTPEIRGLWRSLHPKPPHRWEDNPWITALTFHRANVDEVAG